ncbi:hypothetical protein Drorol1_Dr00002000, partial [Drosera rotundifolia]
WEQWSIILRKKTKNKKFKNKSTVQLAGQTSIFHSSALSTQPPQKPPPFTDLLPSPAAARRHHTSTTSHGGTLIHLINTSAIFSVKLDSESHLNYTQKRNSLTFFPLFFLSPNNITRFFLHLFAVFLGGLFIARNWYLPICSN